ncbi:ATP-dependent DNA helicase PIF1 isoform X1 [Rhizophagus irregularis DAOM 181602=DAOM 197198]|nr:ATP-dependent DNA helicase PIF1 isoform X1 [Rhizophagus irregularis DAOM 181602=DAOM 197198]
MNRYAFEALDRTLRDIMKALNPNLEGKPFGDIVELCLCQSTLWKHVNVMKLKINMRLFNATNNSTEQAEFAKWLLEVGEGRVPAIFTIS